MGQPQLKDQNVGSKPDDVQLDKNQDPATVDAFSDQWDRFHGANRQSNLEEQRWLFDRFFSLFPYDKIGKDHKGFEIGCGTGRYAQFLLPDVGHLTLVDASPRAIAAAKDKLKDFNNVDFINEPVGSAPIEKESMDFGYSYGVLMCVPDTQGAIDWCASLCKPGAPFLIYMYYRFDNRPAWFRAIWKVSDWMRMGIAAMPPAPRSFISELMAYICYWPLARLAWLGEKAGLDVHNWPLSDFRKSSILRMRNNSRDRFGTPLEKRYTRAEMQEMMEKAGFKDIKFLEGAPYWSCVGYKA